MVWVALQAAHLNVDACEALLVEDAGNVPAAGGTRCRRTSVGSLGWSVSLMSWVPEGDLRAGDLLAVGRLGLAGAHVQAGHEHLVLTLGRPQPPAPMPLSGWACAERRC
jgi:hypothetical protein